MTALLVVARWLAGVAVCRARGHRWRPYASSVGWRGVRYCPTCRRFNARAEWS